MTHLTLDEASRKKQLGQYFTGRKVGRLLAALAGAESAKTIIDPMVGSGDLLQACLEIGAEPTDLVGLELDPLALTQAEAVLGAVTGVQLVLTDAFQAQLPADQFDLVITNPPYIRYQSRANIHGVAVPNSEEVRADLIEAIGVRVDLPDDYRARLIRAAEAYPGTADIAVPAWILSAALVKEGGMLAVVAPQAWLSRNYAHAVRELLDEAFEVELIVEDGDASWFTDALVRTNLVVARRRTPGAGRTTIRARATRCLERDGSLTGPFASETEVAKRLRLTTSAHSTEITTGLTARADPSMLAASTERLGIASPQVVTSLGLTDDLLETRTLESYGWQAGQGLRTGANEFFYVSNADGVIVSASRWGARELNVPPDCLLPVIRRQSEIGSDLTVVGELSPSRVLNLRGWVAAADLRHMGAAAGLTRVLPDDVSRWISEVAATPLSTTNPDRLFPELTAVATNVKTDGHGQQVAFWYQLPRLAPRHTGSVFLPRVCGAQPRAYLNSSRVVIDANFSTLWALNESTLPADALVALMNSGWVWANLESMCTVLGGGALKVEATDLRRLPLPALTANDIRQLTRLGRSLLRTQEAATIRELDEVVAAALARPSNRSFESTGPRSFAESALRGRSRK